MADRVEYEVNGKSLSQLRVVDLKQELEKRGLPKGGSKKELVDRLKVQLQLEKLQENASTDEGHVPNLKLQDDAIAEENDVIKEYLAKQQQIYEVQKEVRRRVELEELKAQESSEAEASPGDTSQEDDKEEAASSSRRHARPSRIPARARVVFDDEDDEQPKPKEKVKDKQPEKSREKVKIKDKADEEESEEMEISVAAEEMAEKSDKEDGQEPVKEAGEEEKKDSSKEEKKDASKGEKKDTSEEEVRKSEDAESEKVSTKKDEDGNKDETMGNKGDVDAKEKAKEVATEKHDVVEEKSEEIVVDKAEIEPRPEDDTETNVEVSAEPVKTEEKEDDKKEKVAEGLPLPCDLSMAREPASLPEPKTIPEEDRGGEKSGNAEEDKGKSGEGHGGLKAPDIFTMESDTSCEPLELTSDAVKSRRCQPSAETDEDISGPEGDGEVEKAPTPQEERKDVAEDQTSQEPMNLVSCGKGEEGPSLDDKDQQADDEGPKDSTEEEARDLTRATGESATRSRSPSRDRSRSVSRSPTRSRSRSSRSRSSSRSKSRSRSPSPDVASRSPSPSGRRLPPTKREPTPLDHEAMESENSPSHVANDNGDGKTDEPMEVAPSPGGLEQIDEPATKEENSSSECEPKVSSRRISLSSAKENGERTAPVRKRRWGSTSIAKTSLSISTDSLKGLIPDVKIQSETPVPEPAGPVLAVEVEEDLTLEPPAAKKDLKIVRTVTQVIMPPRTPEKVEAPVEVKEVAVTRRIVLGRQVSRPVIEGVDAGKRAPSPARNQPSKIVHIRNLVRPFTLNQLKEMLGTTGVLVNDGFWIDKIKSKCYVTYSSAEEAVATRLALHGTKWPSSNPKNLAVDFAEQDELDFHKNLTEIAEGVRPVAPPLAPMQPLLPPTQKQVPAPSVKTRGKPKEKEKEKEKIPVGQHQRESQPKKEQKSPKPKENVRDSRMKDGKERERRTVGRLPPPPIREWDRDKIGERSPGERDRARMQAARERRRSPVAAGGDAARRGDRDKRRGKERGHKEEEAPAKLLDDLFRKTKATPCIYWLPLTIEQIKQKEEERKLRQMEREKRKMQIAKEERDKEEVMRKERDDIHRNRTHMMRKH